jgi:hypothetical protein
VPPTQSARLRAGDGGASAEIAVTSYHPAKQQLVKGTESAGAASSHYHLLVETPEANLAKGMRKRNGVYTQGTAGTGPARGLVAFNARMP